MKQTRPITFVNGKLVTPEGVVEGTLRIADGMSAAIGAGQAQPDDESADALRAAAPEARAEILEPVPLN